MKKQINLKSFLPYLLVISGFAALSWGYMSPVLKGKVLIQSDPVQAAGLSHEVSEFYKKTGEFSYWTNSAFGGMPTYFIAGRLSKGAVAPVGMFTTQFGQGGYIFFYLLGAYLLLLALECGMLASLLGAIAFAFFSYNIQIIEAGHISKVNALAFSPIMMAGMVWAYRDKSWIGAAVFSLGLGLDLWANHAQITFYSGLLMIFLGIFELVRAIQQKYVGKFLVTTALIALFGAIVVANNTSTLWTTFEYTKETIRGKSELSPKPGQTKVSDGLDRDYAFAWSYGKLESLTLLIPNFSGGASGGELDEKSEVYKTLGRYNIPPETASQFVRQISTYWGDQTFVGGGIYAGAIICFLFVLGLFIADNRYKYPFAVAFVFFLFISWGKNLAIFNYTLFDYAPMFNKFRAVSMAMSLVQLCMAVIAALGVKSLLANKPNWSELKRPFYISLGLTGGVALLFALVPGLFDFRSENDPRFVENLTQQFGNNRAAANEIYTALLSDRSDMLRADAFRSLIFILLGAGLVWAYANQMLKNVTAVAGLLAGLVLIDMWAVDRRYLNNDSFQQKYYSYDDLFQPSPANLQIMQDTDPNYRVIDLTTSPFQDAKPSYFHKSLGGYHGATLRRYREVVDAQMSKNNMAVYNMLNTRYFIVPAQDGQPTVQRNPEALGNAWFVKEVKQVNNADEELKALDSFNPRLTAFVDKRFADQLKTVSLQADTSATIRLTEYKPNHLTYASDSKVAQVAVFSEIYYRGGIDWKAYVDGQETPHFRANYILRAMTVPSGKHKIEFKFDPPAVKTGQQIDRFAAVAWILLLAGAVFMEYRRKPTEDL
ncbi:hypothetical protein DR864_24980 [Runella rosea]|uniref:Membrane protein YfhO n=1 Tax=Runella rosea TaxID=2259595 RepID=A0A344TQ33_9BACT|nr:YfhO family protein [Runella rosea]AXE20754.1 hypothetical protein DR864_24980 [Runella rosea]